MTSNMHSTSSIDQNLIDHQKNNVRAITLKKLIDCSLGQQKAIREIRNHDGVRQSMYTDHLISEDEHHKWIERLKSDTRQIVFLALDETEAPVGLVSVNALDQLHKKADWAFYLDQKERGGLGAALEFALINFVFDSIGCEKLNCEVIESNAAVVKLHKKFNFKEEGFRRSNIIKNGERIGVFFLGLTKEDWITNKNDIIKKYQPILSKFSVTISV